MHVDSWECGSQNWSDNFAAEFKKCRGYDLMPYLPLLAGIPMESAARSEQILRDVRTTIGELVTDVFYTCLLYTSSYGESQNYMRLPEIFMPTEFLPVSYTHLDVYKRQSFCMDCTMEDTEPDCMIIGK